MTWRGVFGHNLDCTSAKRAAMQVCAMRGGPGQRRRGRGRLYLAWACGQNQADFCMWGAWLNSRSSRWKCRHCR
jgi:hypothetical protein